MVKTNLHSLFCKRGKFHSPTIIISDFRQGGAVTTLTTSPTTKAHGADMLAKFKNAMTTWQQTADSLYVSSTGKKPEGSYRTRPTVKANCTVGRRASSRSHSTRSAHARRRVHSTGPRQNRHRQHAGGHRVRARARSSPGVASGAVDLKG